MLHTLTALCLFATTAHAVPAQFTHQGRLLDAEGAPLEADTTITFRILDAETDGGTLWEETLTLPLTNGFYSAVLGSDESNPLDTDTLGQDPVWLELQLDGEEAMAPRSSINAVPYATMSTVAEEVSGGPVDASDISVGGTPVVNESGEWVGPAPTVSWDDLTDVPADFADGVDDDTLPGSDSFADLGVTCMANQYALPTSVTKGRHFYVYFGHQWTRCIKYLQPSVLRFLLYRAGYAMGTKDHDRVVWHFRQFIYEYRAAGAQVIHDMAVVDHLMTHVDRPTENLQGPIDNIDGTINTGTKASGIGEYNIH